MNLPFNSHPPSSQALSGLEKGVGSGAGAVFAIDGLMNDCNGNLVPDCEDIASGTSTDVNSNELPDECEAIGTRYCVANPNSSGSGAAIHAFGSETIAENDLTLFARDVAPNQFGYYLMSASQGFVPLFAGSQGNLCLGAPIVRFNIPPSGQVLFSGPAGEMTFGPDLTSLPQGVLFQPGETWNFQLWFRDVVGPVFTSNTSDGVEVTFL